MRLAALADEALRRLGQAGWRRHVAIAISLAVLAASLHQLSTIDAARMRGMLPTAPLFWLLFVAYYLSGPAADWLIFRRLWALPLRGFGALLRKTISNEVLLGYSGEVFFYTWARRNVRLNGTPFGAIKDVAILSAAAGNIATLVLFMVAWPFLPDLHAELSAPWLGASVAVITIGPLVTLLFGNQLLTLRAHELRFVGLIHVLRIAVSTILVAAVWGYLMPAAPIAWWLVLATLRLLVSRLPFVPNKEIAFAAVATLVIGSQAAVSDLLTLVAALVVGTHILLGAVLFVTDLATVDPGDIPGAADGMA